MEKSKETNNLKIVENDDKYKFMNEDEVFFDLKRRVKLTRKARIIASKRLRAKHELYEKITHFYSVLVLVLSIWFIGGMNNSYNDIIVTKVLLILSLSLTFFTMYINIKNYKERASAFESNYRSLDILLNRMERQEIENDKIDKELIKELHREYEKLLLEKENHHEIDFMNSSEENIKLYKDKILRFKIINFVKNIMVSLYPVILLLLILLSSKLLKFFFNK